MIIGGIVIVILIVIIVPIVTTFNKAPGKDQGSFPR
jgi:hypothetical protein